MASALFSMLQAEVSQIGYSALDASKVYFNAGGGVAQMLLFDMFGTDLQVFTGKTGTSTLRVYVNGSTTPVYSEGAGTHADGTISWINGEFHSGGSSVTPFVNATPGTLLPDQWNQIAIVDYCSNNYPRVSFAVVGSNPQIRKSTLIDWAPPGTNVQGGTQVLARSGSTPAAGLLLEPIQLWNFAQGLGTGTAIGVNYGTPDNVVPNNYQQMQSLRIKTPANTNAVGLVCGVNGGTPDHGTCLVFVDGVKTTFQPAFANGLTKLVTGSNASTGDAFKLCDVPVDGNTHIVDMLFIEQGFNIGFIFTAGGAGGITTAYADHRPIFYCGGDSETNGGSAGDTHYTNWWPARFYEICNYKASPPIPCCIVSGGLSGTFIDTAYGTTSAIDRATAIKAFITSSQATVNPVTNVIAFWGTNDWADVTGTIATAMGSSTDASYNARFALMTKNMLTAFDAVSNVGVVTYTVVSPAPRPSLSQLGGPRYSVIGPNFPATAGHNTYVANSAAGVAAYVTANPTATNVRARNLNDFNSPSGEVILTVDGSGHYVNNGDLLPDDLHFYTDSGATKVATAMAGIFGYSTVATSYTFTGPSSGTSGAASTNFTLTPNGTYTGTITPSDGGNGGTFTPSSLTWAGTSDAKTFTYTPASTGTKTLSVSDTGGLTDPSNLTYTSNAPAATGYSLSGPASGVVNAASTSFTVALTPDGGTSGGVTITPASDKAGTFSPSTVNLSTGSPSATFTFTPTATGTHAISTTDSGSLTDPSPLSYVVSAAPAGRAAVDITQAILNAVTPTPTGTTINATNGASIAHASDTRKMLIRIRNTAGSTKAVTFKAGVNPPAVAAGLGDLALNVPSSGDMLFTIEAARFMQADGSINVDFASGMTGTISAIQLP